VPAGTAAHGRASQWEGVQVRDLNQGKRGETAVTLPVRRPPGPAGRWDPFRELDDLHQRMNQLMSSVFGAPLFDGADGAWTPLADVSETSDAYIVEIDLPGVKRDDIDIQFSNGVLTISGQIKEKEAAGWQRSRMRRTGRFEYRTTLPQGVDAEKISAELADGVLTVRAPKSETARPRRIPITS